MPSRPVLHAPQRQRLNAREVDELVAARRRGETIDSLAETFGVHRTTVMSIIRPTQRNH